VYISTWSKKHIDRIIDIFIDIFMLEKYLEQKIVNKAKKLGFLSFKFASPKNKGVPDRIFIAKNGNLFFVEFKSNKGKLTELQKLQKARLETFKQSVYIVNNEKLGCDILESYCEIL
jgi:hypothetical protein